MPVARRPNMPPTAVPPIYNPIALPRCFTCISSPRYTIAIAGTPASTIPYRMRQINKIVKFGLNELTAVIMEVAKSENPMIFFRPQAFEREDANVIMIARRAVVADSTRLAMDGLT